MQRPLLRPYVKSAKKPTKPKQPTLYQQMFDCGTLRIRQGSIVGYDVEIDMNAMLLSQRAAVRIHCLIKIDGTVKETTRYITGDNAVVFLTKAGDPLLKVFKEAVNSLKERR